MLSALPHAPGPNGPWGAPADVTGFLSAIGRRLGKPVLMDPEGDPGYPVPGFDVQADRVILPANPRFT